MKEGNKVEDFYFAYGYDEKTHKASRLCRHINSHFEQYNKAAKKWEVNNELSSILIGDDWDYDEITEDQANEIIENI